MLNNLAFLYLIGAAVLQVVVNIGAKKVAAYGSSTAALYPALAGLLMVVFFSLTGKLTMATLAQPHVLLWTGLQSVAFAFLLPLAYAGFALAPISMGLAIFNIGALLLTVLVGVTFLGETLSPLQYVGVALGVAAIALIRLG